jgi:hypothetical protein
MGVGRRNVKRVDAVQGDADDVVVAHGQHLVALQLDHVLVGAAHGHGTGERRLLHGQRGAQQVVDDRRLLALLGDKLLATAQHVGAALGQVARAGKVAQHRPPAKLLGGEEAATGAVVVVVLVGQLGQLPDAGGAAHDAPHHPVRDGHVVGADLAPLDTATAAATADKLVDHLTQLGHHGSLLAVSASAAAATLLIVVVSALGFLALGLLAVALLLDLSQSGSARILLRHLALVQHPVVADVDVIALAQADKEAGAVAYHLGQHEAGERAKGTGPQLRRVNVDERAATHGLHGHKHAVGLHRLEARLAVHLAGQHLVRLLGGDARHGVLEREGVDRVLLGRHAAHHGRHGHDDHLLASRLAGSALVATLVTTTSASPGHSNVWCPGSPFKSRSSTYAYNLNPRSDHPGDINSTG